MECLYYTNSIISNRKTLTKLCLLFDTIRTFYLNPTYYLEPLEERWQAERKAPFFKNSPCEIELFTKIYSESYKNFLNENDELIKSNILQPIIINQTPPDWISLEENEKKLMENGSGIALGLWGQSVDLVPREKIYIDAPWFSLYRWQSISGALHFAIQSGQIPISDNSILSGLACETVSKLSDLTYQPSPDEIANQIAFRAMSLLIPDFPALKPEEILEARDKLSEELHYFREEMYKISSELDTKEYSDIDRIVIHKVQPRLNDLELKIKSLDGEIFRKMASVFFVGSGATTLSSYFLNLPLPAQIAATASFAGKILLDIHENKSKRYDIKNKSVNRGLVFLLDIKNKYK